SVAAYQFATGRLQTAPLDPETYNLVDYGVLQGAFDPAGDKAAFTLEGLPENDDSQASYRMYVWDLQSNELKVVFKPGTPVNPNLLPADHTPLVAQWMPEGVLLSSHVYQANTYYKTILWQPDTGRITEAADSSPALAFRSARLDGGSEILWADYNPGYPT